MSLSVEEGTAERMQGWGGCCSMNSFPLPLGEGGAAERESDRAKPQEKAPGVRVASLCKSCDPHPTLSQRERVDLSRLQFIHTFFAPPRLFVRSSSAGICRS